jgi:hypothetical protein
VEGNFNPFFSMLVSALSASVDGRDLPDILSDLAQARHRHAVGTPLMERVESQVHTSASFGFTAINIDNVR